MQKADTIFMSEVVVENKRVRPKHVIFDLRFNPGGNFMNIILLSEALPRVLPLSGKVLVLVGPGTFSAALVTAALLKGSGGSRTVLIGETMGDDPQFWAEGREMPLPHSRIWLQNATGFQDWANGCNDTNRCFWPNVAFSRPVASLEAEIKVTQTFGQYAAGIDPVLEAALRLIGSETHTQ